jgi:pyridoxine 4-dehydrogenase
MSPVAKTVRFAGRELRRIGLGTNRLTDGEQNRSFLRGAVDAGVQMIDTAHLYTSGESEATIGAALSPFPPELAVGTKGGYHGGGADRLRSELEQSFERLRVDVIELYYLHRLDPEESLPRTLSVLAEYHEAGRIRHVGLSEVAVEDILLGRSVVPITAVQNEYSVGQRRHDEVVDFCDEEGILFVPFFPLRGGGKEVEEIAKQHDASLQQIKLAWLLRRSPAILPIPGTLSLEHLEQNLGALEIELSDSEYEALQ